MAFVIFLTYLFLCCGAFLVNGDECVTYDFENDIDNLFINDKGMCAERELLSWHVKRYSDIAINSPHPNSATFISAPLTLSCGSTFEFPMTGSGTVTTAPSGILEAKVYVDFNSTFGYIIMDTMIVSPNGQDITVSEASFTSYDNIVVSGWQTLRIERIGRFGTNRGYVTFLGRGGANSLILVDSFRYIPPGEDEESCLVYKDSSDTTTAAVTESTTETTEAAIVRTTEEQYTTTELIDNIEKCVTFNFESNYDILFSTDSYICKGLLPWQLQSYTSNNIDSPNSISTVFITPNEAISCISSSVFKMEPGGTIEAKVFMKPVQNMDHIIIQAYRLTDREQDTVAGFLLYHQGNEEFIFGWNVIRFNLLETSAFEGYLIFIGSADNDSIVLVESVRYIPPLTPPEHSSCELYY